jgi:hypothetical protein
MKNRLVYYLTKDDMPQFKKGRLGDPKGEFILDSTCQIANEDPGWTQPDGTFGFSISNVSIGELGAGDTDTVNLAKTVLYLCADSESAKNGWSNALPSVFGMSTAKPMYIPGEACLDRTCITLHLPKLMAGSTFTVPEDGQPKSILLSLSDTGMLSWYDILFGKEVGSVHIDLVKKVLYSKGAKGDSTITLTTDAVAGQPPPPPPPATEATPPPPPPTPTPAADWSTPPSSVVGEQGGQPPPPPLPSGDPAPPPLPSGDPAPPPPPPRPTSMVAEEAPAVPPPLPSADTATGPFEFTAKDGLVEDWAVALQGVSRAGVLKLGGRSELWEMDVGHGVQWVN